MNNVLGHGLIDYIIVVFFVLFTIYAALTKTHRVLYILPAAVSFFFFIQVGPMVTPDKVVPAIFLLFVLLRFGWDYFRTQNTSLSNWIFIVFIGLILSSFIGSFATSYFGDYVVSSHLSNRLYIQLISYINAIFIFIIVRKECLNTGGVERLLKAFVWTTSILAMYGVYQYFADKYGLPYRGIIRSASKVGIAKLQIGEDSLFRVNSFASEPKRLTYFIVIGILILIKYKNYFSNIIGRLLTYLLIAIHLLVLWWTYSTSIYFSLAIFILGLTLFTLFINNNQRLVRILFITSAFGAIGYYYQQQDLDRLYKDRVEDQLQNEEVRAEVKGIEFIQKYPGYFIFGIGPGMYNFALAKEYPGEAGLSSSGKFLIPFNVAIVTYLYDFGIVGLFVLLVPLLRLIFFKNNSNNQVSLLVFFIYCVCFTLDPTPTLFLLLGVFDAENIITR